VKSNRVNDRLFHAFGIMIIALAFSALFSAGTSPLQNVEAIGQSEHDTVWQVNDIIKLTSGWIEWSEQWYNPQPDNLIRDGLWYEYHIREYLIDTDDVFLKLDEIFSWSAVNNVYLGFENWTEFQEYIVEDPAWWLGWSWDLDCVRYGILANRTFIDSSIEEDTAFVTVWCHVTQVAEYLIGTSLGVGESFDLRSISLGKLETYEYYLDYTEKDQLIFLHFSAPSNILQTEGESFIANIYTNPLGQREPSGSSRNITIVMPSSSEIKKAETTTPKTEVKIDRNMATFSIKHNETLPSSFVVTSGPYQKTMVQIIADHVVSPEVVATIIGFLILFPSSIQGIRMIRRSKTYNRLMDLSVKIYQEQRMNPDFYAKEMDNLTESIFKAFIENRLTDEQLEKLLHRRDDFLKRSIDREAN